MVSVIVPRDSVHMALPYNLCSKFSDPVLSNFLFYFPPSLPLFPVPINSISHLSIPFYTLSSLPPSLPPNPPDPSALLSHLSAFHPTAPILHISHFSISLPFPLEVSFCVFAVLSLSTTGPCFSFCSSLKLVLTENDFLSWDFLFDCPTFNDTSLI